MKQHHCQNILQYRLQFVFQLSNTIFMDGGRYTSVHSPVRFPNLSDYPRKLTCKTKSTRRQVANYSQWTNDCQLTPSCDNQHVNIINTKAPAVPCPEPSGSHSTLQETTSASLATHPPGRKSSNPTSYSEGLAFKSSAVRHSGIKHAWTFHCWQWTRYSAFPLKGPGN